MFERIHSIKDEKIELARTLNTRKGRQKLQKILLEGEEILDWALANHLSVEYILVSDKIADCLAKKYQEYCPDIYLVSEGILKKVTDTSYVIPLIGVAKMPQRVANAKPQFVTVLDSVRDFGNIGTIIRTCQAFGIKNIISTTADLDIYQRKTIDASRGNVFNTLLESFPNPTQVIKYLKEQGYQIVATSPKGSNLQSLIELKPGPVALVVGNETVGISPEFEENADLLIQIPMSPTVESLNVGVAAGISIYELKLKQVLVMIEQRIKSTLGRELNVAGVMVQQALDVELRKVSNLTSQQVIFMMVLKCDGKMSLEEMCKQFGLLETEAGEFLKPLLENYFITHEDELKITTKGEEVLAKLWFTVEGAENKILTGFTPEEAKTLLRWLSQIQNRCQEILKSN
jgi:RNA methyltransferase, TrmH family